MILQALTAYYEQLLRTGQISAPGWENQFKVSYWLRINAEGQLIDLVDCRQMVPRGKKEVLAPREMAVPAMSNELPALLQIFCVTIPPICWVQTKKASRSAPSSASKPVQNCTMPFWMGSIPLRPERSLRFLTIGSPKKHRPTRYWLTAGRISPETPTFCSTMKGRRAASCPLKMKRSERHGSSTTAALRPTLRWSSVS